MPYIDFEPLQDLKPGAFKLYAYFLHCAEHSGALTVHRTLAELGEGSGLQAAARWKPPALRHGNDGSLRRALEELVTKGWIEKKGSRGRQPNTYHIIKTSQSPENGR